MADRSASRRRAPAPGVLYFDPNPTTARLAVAGLRLAGYHVVAVSTPDEAVQSCREHGPQGRDSLVAMVIDTAEDPDGAGAVLRAVTEVPGLTGLPGILLINRFDPRPIPGAEGFQRLRRPFTTPALVKCIREAVRAGADVVPRDTELSRELLARLEILLTQHLGAIDPAPGRLRAFASALVNDATIPTPAAGVTLVCDLAATRLDSVFGVIHGDGGAGILQVERGSERVRLHVEGGAIPFAELPSDHPTLGLGRFLEERHPQTKAAFDQIVGSPDVQGRSALERLFTDGRTDVQRLAEALSQQVQEVVSTILAWKDGRCMFFPNESPPGFLERLPQVAELAIPNLLLVALRRIDETAEMGPLQPSAADVLVREDQAIAELGRHAFAREELMVLERLDGTRTIQDIAQQIRRGTMDVARVAFRLTRAGLVRQRTPPVAIS